MRVAATCRSRQALLRSSVFLDGVGREKLRGRRRACDSPPDDRGIRPVNQTPMRAGDAVNSVSVVVLLVGTVIGVTEAALISRACWEFLCRAYPDRRTAKQVAALIAGMAVPLLFGAVILVATLGVGAPGIDTATGLSAVLARVGVLF